MSPAKADDAARRATDPVAKADTVRCKTRFRMVFPRRTDQSSMDDSFAATPMDPLILSLPMVKASIQAAQLRQFLFYSFEDVIHERLPLKDGVFL